MTKFDPQADLPLLHGKVIIVTGGNGGIGFATVQQLARRGAKVYMSSRNEEKCKAAIERLKKESLEPGNGQVEFLKLDLVDPRGAKQSAEEFMKKEERLDVLVNNAAALYDQGNPQMTQDGITQTMATNLLGPFVFTRTLLPLLKATASKPDADVRIVTVGSDAHKFIKKGDYGSKEAWNDLHKHNLLPSFTRYAYSKMAVHLWMNQLHRKLEKENTGITVMMVHPGSILSDGAKNSINTIPGSFIWMKLAGLWLKPATFGAQTSSFAAGSPIVHKEREKYHGAFIVPGNEPAKQTSFALDEGKQQELWDFTEKLLKELNVD